MRRALPYALFGAVTLAVFWKFLLFGYTLHVVGLLETELGLPVQEPPAWWFRPDRPHARVVDDLILLPNHLRIYNEGLKHGELRLWNPSLCCGVPIYADPMTHVFYPPQALLHAIFPVEPAYELFLLLHFFFSGTAMYWLVRGLGRSNLAATAAGLVWMLSGYGSMWFSTGILAGVSVWGPLALLALLQAAERRDLARGALAGLAMGMAILGSHPQHALHFFLLSLGWLGVTCWKKENGRRFPLRATAIYTLLSVGVGLAAILTRLETIANGQRDPEADFQSFYPGGLELPPHLLDAVTGKVTFFDNPFFEYEFAFYLGIAAITLAFVGAARNFGDPRVRLLSFFALASVSIAFLKPLAFILQRVPLLNLSLPSRWLFIFGMAVSLLAGYGWDSMRANVGHVPRALAGLTTILVAAMLLRLGSFRFDNGAALETLVGSLLATTAAFVARSRAPAGALVAMGAIFFELFPPFLTANWHVDPTPMTQTPAVIEAAKAREAEPWRGTGTLGSPYSSVLSGSSNPQELPGTWIREMNDSNNLLALFGVDNAAGFEAVVPAGYYQYCLAAGAVLAPGGRSVVFLNYRNRLIDAMNVKLAFLPPGMPVPPRFRPIPGKFGTVTLYENPAALPRAWLVGRVLPARDEKQVFERIVDSNFDPRSTAVLEGSGLWSLPGGRVQGKASFVRRQSDRLELRVTSSQEALLVLSENDYPGWEARVDGKPVQIHRANGAFRAVFVPAGEHAVEFRFRPESARGGALFSMLFLALGGGFVILARRFTGVASLP